MRTRSSFRQRFFSLTLPAIFLLFLLQLSLYSMGQQKPVSGKVINAKDNAPVAGATVTIKGTKLGTSTNDKGEFSLQVNENQILVVSAVGFSSAENKIDKKNKR